MMIRKLTSFRTIAALLVLLMAAAWGVPGTGSAVADEIGSVYYVDSTGGNDTNAGTSPAAAWQSLDKVNATVFEPGDAILFKAGGVWNGKLSPKGSGTDGHPIRIDRYGEGAKPLIAGGGVDAAVYFYNQEQWEVRNLEITNDSAAKAARRGIHVDGTSGGFSNPKVYRHFLFENLDIHNVKGDVSNDYAHNGGIIVWGTAWDYHVTDVTVNNCKIYAVDSVGVYLNGAQRTYSSNLKVTNNLIYDVAADGAFILNTTNGLIERNVVHDTHVRATGYHVALWTWGTKDAIIQYNEVYNTGAGGDAQAFDSDYNSEGTIIQYNYSHNNAGGMVLVCNDGTSAANYNNGTIVRYNISQNDGGAVFNFNGTPNNTKVYNNTVYLPRYSQAKVINHSDWGGYAKNTSFYNNIVYNLGSGGYSFGNSTNNMFEHNVFYGNHPAGEPADPYKIVQDPMLASPGSAGNGLASAVGYQLLDTSPAIGAGALMTNNGGRDFFGNAVSGTTAPNIGAYAGAGLDPDNLPELPSPPPETNLLKNGDFETGDFAYWPNAYNGASVVSGGEVHAGTYAAKLTGNYAGAEQVVGGLQPNTIYKLFAWGKSAGGGDAVFGVKNFGGASAGDVHISATSYGRKELTFTTGNSSTSATIYLYKAGGSGSVLFDDMELIQFSASPGGNSGPGTTYPIGSDDEFNAGTLDDQWRWIRENPAKWSLGAQPGYLRIVAENGDIAGGTADAKNILLTGAPDGDWTLDTKLDGKPTSTWSQGGLIVYVIDDTYIRMTRLYGAGNQFQLDVKQGGSRVHEETADTIASPVAYLRIQKVGDTYTGYYSADGVAYTQVGTARTVALDDPKIGLIVCAGTGLTANFDYFHIVPATASVSNLLANPGFETGDFSGWNAHFNNAAIVGQQARSGDYAAVLTTQYGGIQQFVNGLEPNTSYTISVYAKATDGASGEFSISEFGSYLRTIPVSSADYQRKSYTFTTGATDTKVKLELYKRSAGGAVYFDDLELIKND